MPGLSPHKIALSTMTLPTIPEDPEREARRFGLIRRHPSNNTPPSKTTNQHWCMDRYSGTIGVPLLRWEVPAEPESIDAIPTKPDNLMEDLAELLAEEKFSPKSSAWTEWSIYSIGKVVRDQKNDMDTIEVIIVKYRRD